MKKVEMPKHDVLSRMIDPSGEKLWKEDKVQNIVTIANKAIEEREVLIEVLEKLLEACYKADLHDELSDIITGDLLGNADNAISAIKGEETE